MRRRCTPMHADKAKGWVRRGVSAFIGVHRRPVFLARSAGNLSPLARAATSAAFAGNWETKRHWAGLPAWRAGGWLYDARCARASVRPGPGQWNCIGCSLFALFTQAYAVFEYQVNAPEWTRTAMF